MTCRLRSLTVAAADPTALRRFWTALLPADPGFALEFREVPDPKTGPNQAHFDLTSTSDVDQQSLVDRALALGARHHDVGQTGDEGHVVLADPEGNEFCVIEPENAFLAGTAPIGALSCDGTKAVGHFWSAALGWPLVWDQDEETAIQSPDGGPKISWGGPPLTPRVHANRLRLVLDVDGDRNAEVERLLALGAQRISDQVLEDPDGNAFEIR